MKSHSMLLGVVGVNVAASIPLVLAPQAMASDNMSSTASFLKAAVAEKATAHSLSESAPTLRAMKPLAIKRDLSASSMSEPRAMQSRLAMAPVAGAVKLRPFVPGRKLPSRNEMQGSLAAQMPQLDNGGQANLSGTVNESTFAAQNSSTYSSPGYSSYRTEQVAANAGRNRIRQAADTVASFQRKHAARTMPGQSPATPGQVGFPCAPQAVANINRQAAPTEAEWTQMAHNAGSANNAASEAEDMRSLAAEFAASQPAAHSTAGPAPFPLSLIPEASLKQLIGSAAKGAPGGAAPAAMHGSMSARPQQAMTPSYFGSWHKTQPVAAKAGNLQPSGFHTYLTAHNSKTGSTSASAFKTYSPMAYKSTRRAAPQVAVAVKKVAAAPAVATYGTYHGSAL